MTVKPAADAYIHDPRVDRNYGTLSELRVRSGTTSSPYYWRSYLQFEISGLTGAPTSATLRLWVTDKSGDSGDVYRTASEHPTTGTRWTDTSLTWENAPPLSTRIADSRVAALGSWVEFDVLSAVDGNGVVSFAIDSQSTDTVVYSSGEGDHPPELVIGTD